MNMDHSTKKLFANINLRGIGTHMVAGLDSDIHVQRISIVCLVKNVCYKPSSITLLWRSWCTLYVENTDVWKAMELQVLHKHGLPQSLKLNFLEQIKREREQFFLFLTEAVATLAICHVNMHTAYGII